MRKGDYVVRIAKSCRTFDEGEIGFVTQDVDEFKIKFKRGFMSCGPSTWERYHRRAHDYEIEAYKKYSIDNIFNIFLELDKVPYGSIIVSESGNIYKFLEIRELETCNGNKLISNPAKNYRIASIIEQEAFKNGISHISHIKRFIDSNYVAFENKFKGCEINIIKDPGGYSIRKFDNISCPSKEDINKSSNIVSEIDKPCQDAKRREDVYDNIFNKITPLPKPSGLIYYLDYKHTNSNDKASTKRAGQTIKVGPIIPSIVRGRCIRGNTIHGRRCQVANRIGHLSYQEISSF